jgi:shikimate dehydrogenase
VKTPEVFNAYLRKQAADGVMVPIHVASDGLAAMLDGLRGVQNLGGLIVTVPHKSAIVALCDELTAEAAQIGAVNCIRRDPDGRMVGAILDGIGFVEGLLGAGINPQGMRAYVAGAGGAASAVAFALAAAGVSALTIGNRTEARARALCDRIAAAYPRLLFSTDASRIADQDLVMNATSLGMKDTDPLPLDVRQLHSGQIVAEAIMQPEITALLKAAAVAGCRIHPGLPMLQSQIRLMAEHMKVAP